MQLITLNSNFPQTPLQRLNHNAQEHEKSGVYKPICITCKLSYIGQTNSILQQRYKERTRYIKKNPQSSYALYILKNNYEYGAIDDPMTLLRNINRSTLLYEKLNIQNYHHQKQLIPEQHINEHNPMYQLIYDLHNTSLPYKSTDQ